MGRPIEFSNPISKREAISLMVNCNSSMQDVEDFVIDFMNQQSTDTGFLRSFNRVMNIRLRLFAPRMYQIVYE